MRLDRNPNGFYLDFVHNEACFYKINYWQYQQCERKSINFHNYCNVFYLFFDK